MRGDREMRKQMMICFSLLAAVLYWFHAKKSFSDQELTKFAALILAPLSRSNEATAVWPLHAATIKAVFPRYQSSDISIWSAEWFECKFDCHCAHGLNNWSNVRCETYIGCRVYVSALFKEKLHNCHIILRCGPHERWPIATLHMRTVNRSKLIRLQVVWWTSWSNLKFVTERLRIRGDKASYRFNFGFNES